MKNAFFLSALFFMALYSCKKTPNPIIEPISINKTTFYSNEPNKNFGGICSIDSGGYIFQTYGSFNAKGLSDKTKSLVLYNKKTTKTGYCLLDNQLRPVLVYTAQNGVNKNTVLSLEYRGTDSIIYCIYNYNWVTKVDTLLQQQIVNVPNKIVKNTYGHKGVATDSAYWQHALTECNVIIKNMEFAFNNGLASIKSIPNITDDLEGLIITGQFKKSRGGVMAMLAYLEVQQAYIEAQMALVKDKMSETVSPEDFIPVNDEGLPILVNVSITNIPTFTSTVSNPNGGNGATYSIGSTGPNGGIVFYDKGSYGIDSVVIFIDNNNNYTWQKRNSWRYMEYLPNISSAQYNNLISNTNWYPASLTEFGYIRCNIPNNTIPLTTTPSSPFWMRVYDKPNNGTQARLVDYIYNVVSCDTWSWNIYFDNRTDYHNVILIRHF